MPRPTVASSPAPSTSLPSDGPGVRVGGVILLGVGVTASAIINIAEHRRREAAGMGAVTNPGLLDRLLDLPAGIPVTDPVAWAEMADQPPGIAERGEDGAIVTRRLESPLTIADVAVDAATGQRTACRPGRQLVRRLRAPVGGRRAQAHTGSGNAGGEAMRRRHSRSRPRGAAARGEASQPRPWTDGHGCWKKRPTGTGLPDGLIVMGRRAHLQPLAEPAG